MTALAGSWLACATRVEMLSLLDRCVGLERTAAEVYDALTARFTADVELYALWSSMAADEREHARKLATWRELIAAEPPEHRPRASGFEADVAALEDLLRASRAQAASADEEEAFAIALGLEGSEIDAIYTTLLHSSPLARYPDMQETVRQESARHHRRLLEVAERRCQSEKTRLRIAILANHAY